MFDKTFFVLSPSYHGATLLAKLINAHPEVTTLGDTYPSNSFDQVCGCGLRVGVCPFWRAVRAEVTAERYPSTRYMLPLYPADQGGSLGRLAFSDFVSFWATPAVLSRFYARYLPDFRMDFEAFINAVHRHTRCPGHVFVDGVKSITRVSALQAARFPIGGIIHLYRNPSDFVASSIRNSGRNGLLGLTEHSLRHRLYHTRAHSLEKSFRHMHLSYESMASNVDGQTERVFRFLEVAPLGLEQLREAFQTEWHLMGNASIFEFDGQIKPVSHKRTGWSSKYIRFLAGQKKRPKI